MAPVEEHTGIITSLLAGLSAVLAGALGLLIRKRRHAPHSIIIDTAPIIKAAFEMQQASAALGQTVARYVEQVEEYLRRTAVLEQVKAGVEAHIAAAQDDIEALQKSDANQWDKIGQNAQQIAELRGNFEGRFDNRRGQGR